MSDPQTLASDPHASAFVTANAGSGKTSTLVKRAARLLLRGVPPAAVLCVTFTKAAAAEMQRRLFGQLGGWSVMDDKPLRGALADLEGGVEADFDDRALSEARALFARALDTPGGLKIQTIHAFCEKLLKRFPLEAGVSPGFTVVDDAQAAELAARARGRLAAFVVSHPDGEIAHAYDHFAVELAHADFDALLAGIEARRERLGDYLDACGGAEGAALDIARRCGVDLGADPVRIAAESVAPPALDPAAWRGAAAAMRLGTGKTDQDAATALLAVAEAAQRGEADFAQAARIFLRKDWGRRDRLATNSVGQATRDWLLAEQDRMAAVREAVCSAATARDTAAALWLAQAYLAALRIEKGSGSALDFADLIGRTRALLTDPADAAWVLYKLDGGLDHILVDEAQDTSPEQWDILRALSGDFFSGEGAAGYDRPLARSVFVVGDEKQSIYSFQGAAPERLLEETQGYLTRIEAAGRAGRVVPLTESFRSTPQVLAFVDAVFEHPDARRGVPPPAGEARVSHTARRSDHAGCVDIWALFEEEDAPAQSAWDAPQDAAPPKSARKALAERIAAEILGLVARGEAVFDKDLKAWRPAGFGDVLILVRRRDALFEEILRALKRRGVAVAGADRLKLSDHVAFEDLLALARFALFPGDDLTLAALLRSPFCDVDEDGLYDLAQDREGGLWEALARRAGERPGWSAAHDLLQWARGEALARTPFDFFARALGRLDAAGRSMRSRMLTRLGREAQDAIDEFLAAVLAAEQRGIADLESLAAALADSELVIKRELEDARGEVRVMTAHGAKGLEAPIVFLPDTVVAARPQRANLLDAPDGGFLWAPRAGDDCLASAAARQTLAEKTGDESLRLLYVALTRARDRVVICGRLAARRKAEDEGSWRMRVMQALQSEGVAAKVRKFAAADGLEVTRFGPDPLVSTAPRPQPAAPVALPAWADQPAPTEPAAARYASPSTLADNSKGPAPSPLSAQGGLGRYRRGELIHRLLQLLPDLASDARERAAATLLERERDLTLEQRAEMAAAALGVLGDPQFAAVFGPGSRAEAAIAGTAPGLPPGLAISGRLDRLLVEPDRVLVADFKTNRPAPNRIEDADRAYLVQMAVYVAVLREVFPGRRVEAALVWTDGPRLMPVPEHVIAATLQGLGAG